MMLSSLTAVVSPAVLSNNVLALRSLVPPALRDFFYRLRDRRERLVLFIDDLQWGDQDSAKLLVNLLEPPHSPAFLLIACYRRDDGTKSECLQTLFHALEEWDERIDRRDIPVDPLTQTQSRELVECLLCRNGPSVLARAIELARQSRGNPFFAHELVQGAQTEAGVSEATPVTESRLLDTLVLRRINQAPSTARRILEIVAVAGHPLSLASAFRAAGVGETESRPVMHWLRWNRLIRQTGSQHLEEIEPYHARIREILVTHLSSATIQEQHLHLALALQQSDEMDHALVAMHFRNANKPDQASNYYAMAAAKAANSLAFERAADFYRLALDCHLHDPAQQHVLTIQLADVLANAGRGEESADAYMKAATGANLLESLDLQGRAAKQYLLTGHLANGLATLNSVLTRVGMPFPSK